jgi:hypothetical protein
MAFVTAFRERVEAAYPRGSALARKFEFFWWTYRLELGGLERIELAVAADAERAKRERDAAYRQEVEARIAAALEQSLAGFRAQVGQAFQAVLTHIQSGRPLRDGAVERLRCTIRRFRALNLFEDDALEREIGAFEQACLAGLDPAAVSRTPELQALWTEGLGAVVQAATADFPRSGLTGRLLRRFDVDPEPPIARSPAPRQHDGPRRATRRIGKGRAPGAPTAGVMIAALLTILRRARGDPSRRRGGRRERLLNGLLGRSAPLGDRAVRRRARPRCSPYPDLLSSVTISTLRLSQLSQ